MLNHMKDPVEMSAMQASQVCLGYKPDANSHDVKFVHGFDCKRLAVFAATVSRPGHVLIQFSKRYHDTVKKEPKPESIACDDDGEVIFLSKIDNDDAPRLCGRCQVYSNYNRDKIPVSDVTHYAHRSRRLKDFSCYEFFSIFVIAPIRRAGDKQWRQKVIEEPAAKILCAFFTLCQSQRLKDLSAIQASRMDLEFAIAKAKTTRKFSCQSDMFVPLSLWMITESEQFTLPT